MIKARPRCPVCGTRLRDDVLDHEVPLGDGRDIIEQDIGGRGSISTVGGYDFDEEHAEVFLEKIEKARGYLRGILGIEDDE